jgi:voltage-gated potassium channel
MIDNDAGLPRLGILRLPEGSIARAIVRRLLLALAVIALLTGLLWFDRDGLRDNAHPDDPLSFVDVFYFTVVSLATVGYGDIAPVTPEARLINAVVMTPMRIFVWVLFLGTAYELTLLRLRLREDYQLRQLHDRLKGHTIVCGFGVKGRSIVNEMVAHGHDRDQIVVIDPGEDAVAEATKQGLAAFRGDASSESTLRHAAIDKASDVLVAPDRDDACVLICLTVRNLNPHVHVVAAAREEENIKLIYRAGADLVVAPSVSGGRLMAASVHQRAVAQFLEDIIAFGHGIRAAERIVRAEEAGLRASDLPDMRECLILGVARGGQHVHFPDLPTFRLEPGDAVVYLESQGDTEPQPTATRP